MATTFHDETGVPVAVRAWGGEEVGVVVRLLPLPPAALQAVQLETVLSGDDGSSFTLRELWQQTGQGGLLWRSW